MMAKPMDLELKKAFVELQTKMLETSKKIQAIDVQINTSLRREYQHLEFTSHDIKDLPKGTQIYEAFGRIFMLTTMDDIQDTLNDRKAELLRKASDLEKNRDYLGNSLRESEDNLREMVQQRKEQS